MKKYLGVKIIQAEPMYSTDKEQEGYKVVYEDGYVSWSPKDVFEKAYKELPEKIDNNIKIMFEVDKSEFRFLDLLYLPRMKDVDHFKGNFGDKNYDFGLAIMALRLGHKVARAGWNGKGMWLVYIRGSYSSTGPCDSYGYYQVNDNLVNLDTERLPWIGMKTADEKFVPWLASQTDMLAEDWQIVE